MTKLIWAVCAVVFGTWLVGVLFKLADGLFHLLAVAASLLAAINVARMVSRGRGPSTP